MYQPNINRFKLYLHIVLALFISLLGTSCVNKQKKDKALKQNNLGLPAANMPAYLAGTKFVYNDGSWEEVISVSGGRVSWINHKGYRSNGPSDIVYKRNKWETKTRSGSRVFRPVTYRFGPQNKTLWPLEREKRFKYLEQGEWKKKGEELREYEVFWECKVDETEKLSVPAGIFDTWKIACKKYSNEFSAVTSSPWEIKTYYYAPIINHWVAMDRKFPRDIGIRKPQRKELVAVMPGLQPKSLDSKSKSALQEQFQQALEKNKSGQTSTWKDSVAAISIVTTPIATFSKSGIPCRQYEQKILQAAQKNSYFGLACRSNKGNWRIPRF